MSPRRVVYLVLAIGLFGAFVGETAVTAGLHAAVVLVLALGIGFFLGLSAADTWWPYPGRSRATGKGSHLR